MLTVHGDGSSLTPYHDEFVLKSITCPMGGAINQGRFFPSKLLHFAALSLCRNIMNRILVSAALCSAASAFAQTVHISQPAAEPIPQHLPVPKASDMPVSAPERVRVSLEDLRANPELFARVLDQAVMAGDAQMIGELLPEYRKLPDAQRDRQLVRYAQAALASAEGRHKEAVARYREMIAEDPSLQPVRLHMALALMRDHQDEAAYDQFQRLRGENLPADIARLVDEAMGVLRERRSWTFNANAYYHHEDNINSAPRQREMAWGSGRLSFPERRSANGVFVGLNAEKHFPLGGNFYASLNPGVDIDYYWDAKDYNDFRFRLGAGGGYRDGKADISIEPYAARRMYGDKGYSTTFGGVISGNYWFTPRFRFSANADINRTTHDTRKHLDGNRYFLGLNALYVYQPSTYFFGGINVYDSNAKDASDAFVRYGANVGWGQEWAYGISSRATATYARRIHDGRDFFGIRRKDNEYGVNLALWNRDWHFWGLTPKLNLQWGKTASNHFYYDKNRVNGFIEISRTF